MEDFSKYLSVNRTFSLICCISWIFSPAEGQTISRVVGSRVILKCANNSINTVTQLTWKMKGETLFSFNPHNHSHYKSPKALSLKINMSESEEQQYALIVEEALSSHTGNYTCEITTQTGTQEQTWELIITEHAEDKHLYMIVIAVAVPCACCLIFAVALTILRRVNKQTRNTICSPTAEMQEQREDIYENCLEPYAGQRRGYNQPYHCHTKAH